MRIWTHTFGTAAILILLTGATGASDTEIRKSKSYVRTHSQHRIYDDRDRFGWYPRDANQLKFGSKIWFEQMEAEGRFGGRRGRSGG